MTYEERLEFLKQKPRYTCRHHPTDGWHEIGCPDKEWTKEDLQKALDQQKRNNELERHLKGEDV